MILVIFVVILTLSALANVTNVSLTLLMHMHTCVHSSPWKPALSRLGVCKRVADQEFNELHHKYIDIAHC